MKKLQLPTKSIATARLARDINTLTHGEQDRLKNGSLGLSPERIRAGATDKTDFMNEILQQNLRFIYLRHWLRKNTSTLRP
jgi:hypothetical protein